MARSGAARAWKENASLFAALGDETRLRVVARLCEEGPLAIVRLTEGTELSRQAVTKHLHVLEDAGIVKSERDGRENVWKLQPRRLVETRRWLEVVSKGWDDTLTRLKTFVED